MNEKNLHLILSKKIMANSFTGAIVFGQQRLGKTAYALWAMHDIYDDPDWDVTLDHCFFKLEDVLRYLATLSNEDRIDPVFTWDDAGVFAGKLLYFKDRELSGYLSSLLDTIGTVTKSVILTTPNPESLLKSLRSYEFYRVKITKANEEWQRFAVGYKNIMLPSGTRYIKKQFRDTYSALLPEDVYRKYNTKRKKYTDITISALGGFLDGLATTGDSLKEQIKEVDEL